MGPPPPLSAGLAGRPVALTIAGSDSGGGAGIQADLATFLALGVEGASAVTALTAQTAGGITGVHEVPPGFVAEQIRTVCRGMPVAAAKTGMLASAATVAEVAAAIRSCAPPHLVVDPVLVATSGRRLLGAGGAEAMVSELFPLARVVTPNLDEAGALLGTAVGGVAGMREAARRLHALGPGWVLVTGGHLEGRPVDVLFDGSSVTELDAERVPVPPVHGTGCVLSAAIAAHLALGAGVPDAVARAKEHVTGVIRRRQESVERSGWRSRG